jgi:hypothetical protein
MLISWTSATNAARVYDTCLSKPENRPVHKDWPPERSFKMRPEHVWDGFLLLSLLEDYDERKQVLSVPDTGEQSERFKDAMRERNARFRLSGQPEWGHHCDKCMRVWKEEDGLSTSFPHCDVQGIDLLLDRKTTCHCHRRYHHWPTVLRRPQLPRVAHE